MIGIEDRVRKSFARQGLMSSLNAEVISVLQGELEIALEPPTATSQQHGFVHARAVSAIAGSAAGYSALTLMPEGKALLTTEFKINLLAHAKGGRVIARGRVIKAGRTLTIARSEVFAIEGERETLVAFPTATMISVEGAGLNGLHARSTKARSGA